jgi:Holliday junction resolvase-like predicted endonuclease
MQPPKFWAHRVGFDAEGRVARELESRGINVVGRRIRIAGVELDLLCIDSDGSWIIIEVKSLGLEEWIVNRVSWRQMVRLRRAAEALAHGYRVPGLKHRSDAVELWLAIVGRASVQILQDFA